MEKDHIQIFKALQFFQCTFLNYLLIETDSYALGMTKLVNNDITMCLYG